MIVQPGSACGGAREFVQSPWYTIPMVGQDLKLPHLYPWLRRQAPTHANEHDPIEAMIGYCEKPASARGLSPS
jgi:hypothetical protein